MAIHIASLKASSPMSSAPPVSRRVAAPASRATGIQVRVPESGKTPSFRMLTSAAASAATAKVPAAATPPDPEAAFKALFPDMGGTHSLMAQAVPQQAPTAESVFGDNPWLVNPTGMAPDGSIYSYTPQWFATPQTAATVAQMVGGTVVETDEMTNAPGSLYQQQQPNEMVRLKNGALINAGLVAGFYTHGYPQSFVDQMIANEVANVKP